MKKIFRILAISLFIKFVILVVGLFVFLKTLDVSRFKPQIIAAAQKAIGRSVDFGDIALKLSPKAIFLGHRKVYNSSAYHTRQAIRLSNTYLAGSPKEAGGSCGEATFLNYIK